MKKIQFTVTNVADGMKISEYLKKRLGFSSALITKVKFGGVYLNETNVHMRATVHNGDVISVFFPDESSENIEPMAIPLNIVYEDDDVLAVDKPKNMPTHPSKGNNLPTLANAVAAYYGENFVFRSINRLDRDTSGIVIIAKNPYSAANLGRAMKEHKFGKKYIARVIGTPDPASGRISAPIEREEEGNIKRIVKPNGKTAITDYRVISSADDGTSLCELTLHTGRTHQIRVHMAHIGHALVDDFLYGTKNGDDSYFLRCVEISFPHPRSGETLVIRV